MLPAEYWDVMFAGQSWGIITGFVEKTAALR